jgi:hypothetical protein
MVVSLSDLRRAHKRARLDGAPGRCPEPAPPGSIGMSKIDPMDE